MLLVAELLLVAAVACGGGDDASSTAKSSASAGGASTTGNTATEAGTPTTTGSGGGPASGHACDSTARVGTLGLRLSDGKTLLSGAILDSVNPEAVFEVVASEDACDLLAPRDLFCSECSSGETCAGEEICIPKPTKQSAGTLTITGLAVGLETEPNGITGEYTSTVSEPYPAFEPGAALGLSASGDFFEPFTLAAWGIPAMETSQTTIAVEREAPVALTWDTENVDPDKSEVFVDFSVNVHGTTTGWIECTVPDTGSFAIPAGLVTQLIELGLSGFPRMKLVRRSIDSTTLSTGDCVEFEVSSSASIELEIEGLTSCNDTTPCPSGQSCTAEQTCE